MKVTLKLYAALGHHLPDGSMRNEAEVEVEDSASPSDVLARYGVPPEHCHLVLVNGHYLAPGERDHTPLKDGDALAVWPPVAGG